MNTLTIVNGLIEKIEKHKEELDIYTKMGKLSKVNVRFRETNINGQRVNILSDVIIKSISNYKDRLDDIGGKLSNEELSMGALNRCVEAFRSLDKFLDDISFHGIYDGDEVQGYIEGEEVRIYINSLQYSLDSYVGLLHKLRIIYQKIRELNSQLDRLDVDNTLAFYLSGLSSEEEAIEYKNNYLDLLNMIKEYIRSHTQDPMDKINKDVIYITNTFVD